MSGLVCLGDATTHGGKVITASSTMFINGVQVALVGDLVSCPKHGVNPI
ncbi:PAAR domain-containing protein, partial [Klebsiella pneumoniae]